MYALPGMFENLTKAYSPVTLMDSRLNFLHADISIQLPADLPSFLFPFRMNP